MLFPAYCYAFSLRENVPGALRGVSSETCRKMEIYLTMDYPVFNDPNEKPLDRLLPDGGFCPIFRRIACVGDSLSSGEFQLMGEDGKWKFYDKFEYSWGQFIARTCGNTVYNFSAGGMTAKWYLHFAEDMGYWNPDKKCQAYIIALGVNDLCNQHQEVGDINDVDIDNPGNNPETFAGYYAEIIARYRKIQENPFFFFMTMPQGAPDDPVRAEYKLRHHELLNAFARIVPNAFVLDFYKFARPYDKQFNELYYLNGHLNPCGYLLTAKMVMSYIDYIIRHDVKKFELVGMMQ